MDKINIVVADSGAREARREHKAWGEAQRNPRIERHSEPSPRSRAIVQRSLKSCLPALRTLSQTRCTSLSPVSRDPSITWGYAALHPRLYADASFAGWRS